MFQEDCFFRVQVVGGGVEGVEFGGGKDVLWFGGLC